MKRREFLKLSAAAALTGVAAACGAAPSASASSTPAASSAVRQPASSAAAASSAAPSTAASHGTAAGRTLVACYSATGHTAAVAGYVADATGADLFLLQPVDPYTDEELNYNDSNSRVSREHADPSLQNVELEAVTPEGWADYDTVFVGYPIWWGQAGWPVNGFVTGNDFSGKRVIPFCTSASSGLGSSAENRRTGRFRRLAGGDALPRLVQRRRRGRVAGRAFSVKEERNDETPRFSKIFCRRRFDWSRRSLRRGPLGGSFFHTGGQLCSPSAGRVRCVERGGFR